MSSAKKQFDTIVEKFCIGCEGVYLDKMMSSPGLKFNNKVFAFYYKNSMCFRMGHQFDPAAIGLKHVELLNPFKKKRPMKGWYVVKEDEMQHWEILAEKALDFTMSLIEV